MTRVSARSLADALAGALPSGHVSDDPSLLARSAVDDRAPRWVVRPRSLEDVSRLLALAHEEGLTVIPVGSGSALELGHPVERVDVVLDTRRLDALVEYNPDDLTATVQAGTTAGALAARLAEHRQWLPVDPPGVAGRTLGGLAATNATGPLRAGYGTLRDLLLGVRFVQADGVITWGGARVVKSVSGYDVPKLMVGGLGTLGVLGELTLRLHPMPEVEATALVTFATAEAAAGFVTLVLDSTVRPTRLEFFNEPALAACGGPRARAAVAVSVGTVAAAAREQARELGGFATRAGGEAHVPDPAFWEGYDRGLALERGIVLRVATLVSHLAATVADTEAVVAAAAPGATATLTGCGALGTLRVSLSNLPVPAVVAVVERLRDSVAEVGGSVVIERAPRELRAAVDPWGPVPVGALDLMRGVKDTFDPRRVLNRGRFVGGL